MLAAAKAGSLAKGGKPHHHGWRQPVIGLVVHLAHPTSSLVSLKVAL
jgi:hypothetical protein